MIREHICRRSEYWISQVSTYRRREILLLRLTQEIESKLYNSSMTFLNRLGK